jgi:2-phospho-L-lactate guanylyltransferase (CobY/MobA/RfbA family)
MAMAFKYTPEVTLGSILQILTIAASVFSTYLMLVVTDTKIQAEVDKHTEVLLEQKEVNKEVKQSLRSIEDKLTSIVVDNAKRNK